MNEGGHCASCIVTQFGELGHKQGNNAKKVYLELNFFATDSIAKEASVTFEIGIYGIVFTDRHHAPMMSQWFERASKVSSPELAHFNLLRLRYYIQQYCT